MQEKGGGSLVRGGEPQEPLAAQLGGACPSSGPTWPDLDFFFFFLVIFVIFVVSFISFISVNFVLLLFCYFFILLFCYFLIYSFSQFFKKIVLTMYA